MQRVRSPGDGFERHVTHRAHRIQPLLDHRQRNQCQSRPPARRRPRNIVDRNTEITAECQAPTDTPPSSTYRNSTFFSFLCGEYFLLSVKAPLRGAAPAAGGRGAPVLAGATGLGGRRSDSSRSEPTGRLGGRCDLADASDATHRLVHTCTGSTPGSPLAGLAGPPGQRSGPRATERCLRCRGLRSPLSPPGAGGAVRGQAQCGRSCGCHVASQSHGRSVPTGRRRDGFLLQVVRWVAGSISSGSASAPGSVGMLERWTLTATARTPPTSAGRPLRSSPRHLGQASEPTPLTHRRRKRCTGASSSLLWNWPGLRTKSLACTAT